MAIQVRGRMETRILGLFVEGTVLGTWPLLQSAFVTSHDYFQEGQWISLLGPFALWGEKALAEVPWHVGLGPFVLGLSLLAVVFSLSFFGNGKSRVRGRVSFLLGFFWGFCGYFVFVTRGV